MALIRITVQTMQILNDWLHKVDDKNKTLDKKMHKRMQVVRRRSMLPVLHGTRNAHTGTSQHAQ